MRSYTFAFLAIALGAFLILPVGCAQDDASVPAVHNKDLGDKQQGEVLVPYEPAVNHKYIVEPAQFPLPPMPPSAVPEPASQPAEAVAEPGQASQPAAAQPEAAPPAQAAAAPDAASLAPSPEAEELARQLMADLTSGRFAEIEARIAPELKPSIPAGMLQQQWTAVEQQFGKYQSIEKIVGRKVPQGGKQYDYAEAQLKFEKGEIGLAVAFNADKQIAQLGMSPISGGQPSETPAAETATTPAADTSAAPQAPTRGGRSSAPPVPTPRSAAGMGGGGLGDLPPTAPAPVGLGN